MKHVMGILKSTAVYNSITQKGIHMIAVKTLPQYCIKIQALLLHKIYLIAWLIWYPFILLYIHNFKIHAGSDNTPRESRDIKFNNHRL